MSTFTPTREPSAPPVVARGPSASSYDDYVERRLAKTRKQVRLIDLGTALFYWAACVLGSLLVLACIDHWLFELSAWTRTAAFLVLLGGTIFYAATTVVPLMLWKINPIYAARIIEQSTPTLKNSLVNFLLFRSRRESVQDFVYQAIEQRAATDLSQVNLDAAVDHGRLLKMAALFTAVMFCAGLYKILSPKDPFQTAARVIAPWADIARPSRARILDVQPGDIELFHGQTARVSAQITGLRSGEPAVLVFSGDDKELAVQNAELEYSTESHRYEALLPPGGSGVRENLTYRVIAGDASSPEHRIQVLPSPTIAVERVEYQFPSYTRKANLVVEHLGDIRGLEGARVTIHSSTNQPIRSAALEFDPPTRTGQTKAQSPRQATLTMSSQDQKASVSFALEMMADRLTPKHASYQLSFVNTHGLRSENAVVHEIEVIRDLAPEVEVLTPRNERSEIPENGQLTIEVRAIDPDFGLSQVSIRAAANGADILQTPIFQEPLGETGQVVAKFAFVPKELNLKTGDTAVFWAVAEDNRSTATGRAEPNSQRTRNYQIAVIEPTPEPKPKGSQPSSDNKDENPGAENKGPGQKEGKSKPNSGQQGKPGNTGENGQEPSQKEGTGGKQEEGQAGNNSNSQQSESTDKGPPGAEGKPSEDQQGNATGEQASQQRGGSGASKSERNPNSGHNSDPSTSMNKNQNGDTEPVSDRDEPLHDGEAIEKVLEQMQREGKRPNGKPSSEPMQDSDAAAQPSNTDAENGAAPAQDSNNNNNGGAKPEVGDDRKEESDSAEGSSEAGRRHPDQNQGAGKQQKGTPGEGGKSARNGMEPDRGAKNKPDGPQNNESKKPGIGDNGDSGAGDNSTDKTGSGSSAKKPNPDRPKSQNPDTTKPQDSIEPGAAESELDKNPRQSNAKGGASGDFSGAGKKGPKQGANQAGNDSAGQNSSSDDGAAKSSEPGQGESSQQAGDKQTSDTPTGGAGNEPGQGSSARQNPQGKPLPDGKKGPQPPMRQEPGNPVQQGDQPGQKRGTADGRPVGGGVPGQGGDGDGDGTPRSRPADAIPDGEKANLEYARKATDMAVEYLRNQQDQPDQRLLDQLGWTTDDLEKFLKRWQELKRSAVDEKSSGKKQLDDALRSLGLRPPTDKNRQGPSVSDDHRGLSETGVRGNPPVKYQEQFNAFQKSSGRTN